MQWFIKTDTMYRHAGEAALFQTYTVDEPLSAVRHQNAIAPGGTAGVHVLGGFSVLFAVGVAERDRGRQNVRARGVSRGR